MPGSLFVARKGASHDGTHFIKHAAREGAAAVLTTPDAADLVPHQIGLLTTHQQLLPAATAALAEAFYNNPAQSLTITAITGTNGKTTTAHFLHQILNSAGQRTGLIGTVSIDDGATTSFADMTTPAASHISHTLAAMRDNRCAHAVIEASSHALHQSRLAAILPNAAAAIFTNLSGDHLDYHRTIDDYAAAKAILFESIPPSAAAILNHDDTQTKRMTVNCPAERIITTSPTHQNAPANIAAAAPPSIERPRDISITAPDPNGKPVNIKTSTTLLGEHNLHNLLQATTAALALGLKPESIRQAIPALNPPKGRLERITPPANAPTPAPAVFIDFAHTDAALAAALTALDHARPTGSTLTVVFGAGGDRDRTKRPRMGRVAAEIAGRVVVTSDNPRSEPQSRIISDILEGIPTNHRQRAEVHADRAAAIAHAIHAAAPNDIVLIAGKGHEREQITADPNTGQYLRTHFSDHEHAARALASRTPQNTETHHPTEPQNATP